MSDYESMSKEQLVDELRSTRLRADFAEAGLKASDKRYREIFDQSSVCIWDDDWSAVKAMLDDLAGQGITDFHGYFRDRPEALDALYKLPHSNVVSRGIVDIYGASCAEILLERWHDLTTDEERNGFLDTALSFMAGEMSFEYEAEERTCDGAPVVVYTRATILPGKNNDWSRVIVSCMDVTARKIAERALAESEACLRSYFDHSPTAISLKDLDGRFLMINREFEKALGMSNARVHGKKTHDVYPKAVADTVADREREVVETGKAIEWEQELTGDEGVNHWLLSKFPVLDASGRISMIGSVATNITESKNAERAHIEAHQMADFANRSMSEFLANMSHELRTPLNAIIGFSDIMSGEMLGPIGSPKYLDYAKDIHMAGSHLLELINDILDISKIESGNSDLFEEPVDVHKTLQSCLTLVRQRAEQSGVNISCDMAANSPAMYADERKLKQILINLLSNAIKFTPSDGSITIKAWSSPGDGYVFQVIDTGIGIALADIPKALAPFQQIDSALNRKYEGTGLGLPLTKALAELHGGSLGLESEVGVGTTVTVRFPKERVLAEELTGTHA